MWRLSASWVYHASPYVPCTLVVLNISCRIHRSSPLECQTALRQWLYVPTRPEFGMSMTLVPSSMHAGAADARIVGYVDLQYLQCTSLNIAALPRPAIVPSLQPPPFIRSWEDVISKASDMFLCVAPGPETGHRRCGNTQGRTCCEQSTD